MNDCRSKGKAKISDSTFLIVGNAGAAKAPRPKKWFGSLPYQRTKIIMIEI